ncbi:MAG: hypothetical protein KKA07_08480 [Bacteroidetes bacterium]|nr:hypothetical protein [Bacteroidota bacterium]MBU1719097.1 hypothetical protein [Bacteroidota bacterium]
MTKGIRTDLRILFIQIAMVFCSLSKAQTNSGVTIEFSGQIFFDDSLRKQVFHPYFSASINGETGFSFLVDSSGKYYSKQKVQIMEGEIDFTVHCEKHFAYRDKIIIERNKRHYTYNKDVYLKEGALCVDSWAPPKIFFQENSLSYAKSPVKDIYHKEDSIPDYDKLIKEWIKWYLEDMMKSGLGIGIESYADFNENNEISDKRLDFIYSKFVKLGVPPDKIETRNKNMDTLLFYRYFDGCFPYSKIESDPILVDSAYIASYRGKSNFDKARQLRRIILFYWTSEKE